MGHIGLWSPDCVLRESIDFNQSGHAGERARLSQMRPDNDAAEEISPFVDYLNRYEREHGRKSKEVFKLQDLINSLKWKSSTTIDLKSKDGQGREVVKGRAKARYEANSVFSVSEVRAFNGRFTGDALYSPGKEPAWHWDLFPPHTANEGLSGQLGPLVANISTRMYGTLTDEDRSEVQAMVERIMADYLARHKTQELIAEIDRAEALYDQEWAKEEAIYTAEFERGGGDSAPA
jgi:hypothetical protein